MRPRVFAWAPLALLVATVACAVGAEPEDGSWSEAEIRQELDQFLDVYFAALEDGDPTAVADSYHPEAASIGGRGRMVTYSRPELVERYQWLHESPPGDLWWIQVDHEVLGPDAALTTGIIGWLDAPNAADTLLISYTGLMVRTEDGWRIRHEHESTRQP
ncbi:MAG: SgcJ/EcaC family oxidoreductase [Gemmatimonadetes bacterium]|nr:SgcJ/EcaC family oxidoreductase [Gemmatimonadota bacterium]